MALRTEWSEEIAERITISHTIPREPYYKPQGHEVDIFNRAYQGRQAIALFGPTGSGKNRLVEHMGYKLKRPVITIHGERGVDATELVGGVYTELNGSFYMPGPLYMGAKTGAIIHLEEVLEMESDVLTLLHSLTDWRRVLEVKLTGETIELENGMIVISMNPGKAYQKAEKRFPKPSLAQRFVGIHLGYMRGTEAVNIIAKESGCEERTAYALNALAIAIDEMHKGQEYSGSLPESVGFHALINAGKQIKAGTGTREACQVCIANVLSHEEEVREAIMKLVKDKVG